MIMIAKSCGRNQMAVYSIEEISKMIEPIAVEYQIPAIYLYGSYARGEATDKSDIDVLIDRTNSKIKTLFDLGGLCEDLTDIFNKKIDITTTYALMEHNNDAYYKSLLSNVMWERVLVYGEQRQANH
jgi:predicted nucleotidyltransferase